MAIVPYLAATAAEFGGMGGKSCPVGWMSCLFSPFGRGLSNLPRSLPPGSLLMLSDFTPFQGHDPGTIREQLTRCVEAFGCGAVLLDFQRPGVPELTELTRLLSGGLPCPVAVAEGYGKGLDCPVFLPPVPPSVPPGEYLAPWRGREIWLELALDGEEITLTEEGAAVTPLPRMADREGGFSDGKLHCHYRIDLAEDSATFTLWRTREDLQGLLAEAEELGVTTAVGLYQELYPYL